MGKLVCDNYNIQLNASEIECKLESKYLDSISTEGINYICEYLIGQEEVMSVNEPVGSSTRSLK